MSKKEQKLKKNLYKALTEYFIHNTKNSLACSLPYKYKNIVKKARRTAAQKG